MLGKNQRWVWLVAAGACIVWSSTTARAQVFPLEENVAVATFAPFSNSSGFVVGTYDIRDPDCNGVPIPTCELNSQNPPCITNWPAAQFHNAAGPPADVWNDTNLGTVFGVSLDNAADPNIYVTSTSLWGPGLGRVMKINGTTGAISIFNAALPNSGQGLGNIAFDRISTRFYVTNHEDGKIYVLSSAGLLVGAPYDPFGADDVTPGFCPLGERLWGIEVKNEPNPNDRRLYFGRWTEDVGRPGNPNEVWSLGLNAAGDIVGPETLEVTLPILGSCTDTQPVADIAFSEQGRMLLGERGMGSDTGTAPHYSTVYQYELAVGVWVLSFQFDVGLYQGNCGAGNHANSAGGVDYTDCVEDDACNPGDLAIFMADALDLNPNNIYGLQLTPAAGGSLSESYYVDLDNDTLSQDKTALGDVDVVRTCVQPPVNTGACCVTATGQCVNAVSQADCLAMPGRYAGDNTICATAVFVPPCEPPVSGGACCVTATGQCVNVVTQTVCLGMPGRYAGDNTDCATAVFDPPCTPPSEVIPTTSTWGLVALALLLLALGKVYFGRRRSVA